MKILNLYAGIGGNRKFWGDKHEIVAVESDPAIAEIYKDFYPNDTVIVDDAHEYLRCHFKEFDFIWSSPPCQTHSSIRQNIGVKCRGVEPKFPDMTLYEEIIFLLHNAECEWVVENVRPYYKPLIKGQVVQRHLFWSSFDIPPIRLTPFNMHRASITQLQDQYGFDLKEYRLPNKRQALRNCVHPEIGKHILRLVAAGNIHVLTTSNHPTNPDS